MSRLLDSIACPVAAATIFATLTFAGIGEAATARTADGTSDMVRIADATVTPKQPAKAGAARASVDRTDAWIKELHRKLHITTVQEPAWDAVAQAMRDNAAAMDALIKGRAAQATPDTAIDNLNDSAKMAEAHLEGLKKFIPVFSTLYDSLSPEQKKIADSAFSRPTRSRGTHHRGKTHG